MRPGNTQQAIGNIKIQRLLSFVLCAWVFAFHEASGAQQSGSIPRIGYLSRVSAESDAKLFAVFRAGLRELGYVEGHNIVIEQRYSEGNPTRLNALAAELVRLNVDVIVTGGGGVRAAKKATHIIPIVMTFYADPVAVGLVDSLAHPGGNVTGLSDFHAGVVTKQLELLKEAVPSASRFAILVDPNTASHRLQLRDLQAAAPALGVTLLPLEIDGSADFERAFNTINKERPAGLLALGAQMFRVNQRKILDLLEKNRLPSIHARDNWVANGALMSYGTHWPDLFRRAAIYVDKILKGVKPAKLPVEQPKKFDFVINLKTAKQIGITIPPNLLVRATEVIR